MTTTLYTEINDSLFAKLAKIKLLVCDVDGVFSDGRIYLGNDGDFGVGDHHDVSNRICMLSNQNNSKQFGSRHGLLSTW